MSSFSRKTTIAALMGAAMLAGPLAAMAADSATPAASPAVQAAPTPEAARETVEQRIATLHASLKITPAEEADWNNVAKVMRNNAAAMQKLVAGRSSKDTAVDDLKTYEKFARAHVEGLKTLTASFETLYKAMPDAQKKNADEVFAGFGHKAGSSHG